MENNLDEALKAGGLEIGETTETEYESEVGKKSVEVKKSIEEISNTPKLPTNNLLFAFEDVDGDPIPPREEDGTYFIDLIEVDRIAFSGTQETQIRTGDLGIFDMQQSIEKVDLIEPIHVVPFGRPISTENGLPKYNKYILLSGQRRFEAVRSLGRSMIVALVDTTINKQLIDMYKGIIQNNKVYTFSEKVNYANRMKLEQRSMSVETLENLLGYKSGEFLKSLYIDQMKVDYPDIYTQVEKEKLSIEQGFKRLEKEIEKAEKALNESENEMSGDDVEDSLRAKQGDDLNELKMENHTQELGNRHILDANIRRSVENRDSGTCQCCGFGAGETDLMGGFNAHHIVPVMYQGPDQKANLILLCRNCHGFVHDYELGRFNPDKTTYDTLDWVKKVVVLGNMLRKLRAYSIKEIAKKDPNTHKLLQKGAISLGKAIVKSGITVGGMEMFNNDPYGTFMTATEDIQYGGVSKGEFGDLENFKDDLSEEVDAPEENHKPRNLSKGELMSATKEEIKQKDIAEGRIKSDTPSIDSEIENNKDDSADDEKIPDINIELDSDSEHDANYSEDFKEDDSNLKDIVPSVDLDDDSEIVENTDKFEPENKDEYDGIESEDLDVDSKTERDIKYFLDNSDEPDKNSENIEDFLSDDSEYEPKVSDLDEDIYRYL